MERIRKVPVLGPLASSMVAFGFDESHCEGCPLPSGGLVVAWSSSIPYLEPSVVPGTGLVLVGDPFMLRLSAFGVGTFVQRAQ